MRKSHVLFFALALLVVSGACSRGEPESEWKPLRREARSVPADKPRPQAPPVPPYHQSAEAAKPLPEVLPAAYFQKYPVVARAYRIAARIPEVIAQQPCYCRCDAIGHRSLLDCYASDHGAG